MNDIYNNDNEFRGVSVTQSLSPKKRWIAILLCILLGGAGAHCFYLGYIKSGLYRIVLLFAGVILTIFGVGVFLIIADLIWMLVDLVKLIINRLPDSSGRKLS